MKKLTIITLLFVSINAFSCGYALYDGMSFYNLMNQTIISSQSYYPFLRTKYSLFYNNVDDNEYLNSSFPRGNLILWKKILKNWDIDQIQEAVYDYHSFDWADRNSEIEKSAKTYLSFAETCSEIFSYRKKIHSWDYSEISEQPEINTDELLSTANLLLSQELNKYLKARYYYQIIRLLHYSKRWNDALMIYENEIEGKLPVNEIYYYILDQVAGCYYSLKKYDKAAYLFTKVFNHSYDRKKSAFASYNFCVNKGYEGKDNFKDVEDEKDFLLIKSLNHFTDKVANIDKFIELDPGDDRIELLFMRLVNDIERQVWPKNIGCKSNNLPHLKNVPHIKKLIEISSKQSISFLVPNKDFWFLVNSYLLFINKDIEKAKIQLRKVDLFEEQKEILSVIYEVFEWDSMNREHENTLAQIFKKYGTSFSGNRWRYGDQYDWYKMILDKVSNTYYKDNQIGKAFLIHQNLNSVNYLNSLQLLSSLEAFFLKNEKSDFEKMLLHKSGYKKDVMVDYIYNQKGIYYLQQQDPDSALMYFKRNKSFINKTSIPGVIFSNGIIDDYTSSVNQVMEDEVYKAGVFSFIKDDFSRIVLAENLIELEKLTNHSLIWKRKLANYLLGNFYYNISNTGYFRGLLNNRPNRNQHDYVDFRYEIEQDTVYDDEIIAQRIGFNLSDILDHRRKFKQLSNVARKYFEHTIALSVDDELNARCYYMIAKCELNEYCNVGSGDTFEIPLKYGSLALPKCKSFKTLKDKYSHTKFHAMIINECSYFRHYSAAY